MLSASALAEPLASWHNRDSKKNILQFVEKVTDKNSKYYVAPSDRIATFDNDGTLWSEQPAYFQLFFAIEQIKKMAKQNPGWANEEPFKSLLAGDMKKALSNEENLLKIIAASHSGMTQSEFRQSVLDWMAVAKHPDTNKKFTEMVYQPMLELLDYLRDNGFKVWIVSGGGIDFMRPWVEGVYGIPPENVIGSRMKKSFVIVDGKPVIKRLAELDFIDDKDGKPVGIDNHIGKRPIAAFGNSDGDLQMLQYTAAGDGLRLMVYIHHTDSKREWAYDRNSHIGQLNKGLDEAKKNNWTVVDMQKDWRVIYP
jgi:hypothetical protein